MADEFFGREREAASQELEQTLRALRGSINRELKDLDAQNRVADTRERKAERRVAREEAVARERRQRLGGTSSFESDLQSTRGAQAARQRLTSEDRITAAKRQQEEFQRRINRLQLPPAGGTGVGRYGGLSPAEVAARERRGLTTTGLFAPQQQPRPPRPGAPGFVGPVDDPSYRQRIREQGFATRELASQQAALGRGAGQVVSAQRGVSAATAEAGLAAEVAANRYRRHGALTTEFLEAARRGEVDIRELGFQVSSTIGKFAGWTAAATAVYGVATAMSQLGTGAIASLNGVNQLQRIITTGLDTDQVQQQFRDLSQEFNLPIDQVAESAYQMSKIFGQSGLQATLEGTRAALFAVKVGELDAGEATRFLTSIVQGFGLEANQLPAVMDAINQATNKFGGNVGGMTQGVANASGAFRAAGGDFRDLIALVETGIKVTGRSGSEIGTALRRTAEISQRPERRSSIIQLLGIDPRDSSITDILARAAQVLKTAGPDVRSSVLRAITTPELASGRILPILQNYDLVKRIRREVESDRSAGSSARELQRALRSPGEELARFRNELQRLGSTLGQIGAFDPFILALTGANRLLSTVTSILEHFDALPRTLRTTVALLGAGAAAVRLMRRFNVGSVLPGQPQFLSRSPEALAKATALSGLRGFEADTTESLRRQGLATVAASRQLDFVRSIGASSEDIQAAEGRYTTALQERRFLAQQQLAIQEEINAIQTRGLTAAQTANATALRSGVPSLEQQALGVPNTGVVGVRRGSSQEVLKDIQRQEQLMQVRMAEYGVVGQGLGAVLDKGNAAVIAARNSSIGLRGKLSTRIAGLRAMGPAIGALDGALIGLFVGYEVIQSALANANREDELINRVDRLSTTVQDPTKIRRRLKDIEDQNVNALTAVQDGFADTLNGILSTLPALDAIIPGPAVRAQTPHQDREAAIRRAQQEATAIAGARQAGAAPGFFQRELLNRLRVRLQGAKTEGEEEKLISRAEIDLGSSREQIYGDLNAQQRRRLRTRGLAQISELQRNMVTAAHGLDYQLDLLLNPTQVQDFVQARLNRLQRGFTGTGRLNRGLAGAAVRARELAATATPQDAEKLLQSANQAEQAILDAAKTKLDRALDYARTPQGAARARQQYLGTARGAQIGAYKRRISELQEGIKKREDDIGAQADALDQESGIGTRAGSPQARRAEQARKSLQGLKAQQGEARTRIGELRRNLKEQRKAFNDLQREQDRAQYELELAFFDARTERLQSVTADPLAQANILVGRLRERTAKVMDAFRRHLATQQDVDRAIAQQNQAFQQQAQQQLQRYQLQQQVATSRFSVGATDDELLRRQLADAQSYLARVQSYGNRVSPDDVLNAQRQVYDLQRQIAQQARQNAQAMLEAQERYALAGADTDLEQINIRLRFFRRRQTLVPPRTPVERQQSRADLAELNSQRRNARLQERIDNEQFLLDIGRISKDEFANFIRNFLTTHKNLRKFNRDLYRNLRRQLYQLTHDEGDRESFELNVGDIRLPTVYDVRRALGGPIAAARTARGGATTNNNSITLYVSRDADMAKVAAVLDDYTQGGVKEAARAAGVIG